MVVVLRALGLGDLLTVVPALRALRRYRAADEIVLVTPRALAPLVRRIGAVDRIVAVAPAVTAPPGHIPWHDLRPDLAVNLHGRGPQSTDTLRALDPATLWSYGAPGGPRWSAREHEVARWCRLLDAYGCPADPADLYLDAGASHEGSVVVHPGAATPERRWPVSRYASVARGLSERGAPVVVTAGPGERHLAAAVAARAGLARSAVVSGLDLGELADLVGSSRLVVCGDTGVAHLATACRTPSVVLFGPQPPSLWGPPGVSGPHTVLWRPALGDGAVAGRVHPALLRVAAADVLRAADDALAASTE